MDQEFLRLVRGRFASSMGERALPRALSILFGVACPALFVYALFEEGWVPGWPVNGDQWALLIVTVTSPAMGLLFWLFAEVEYEFTGEEIVCRRRGRVRWRVAISDVERVETSFGDGKELWDLHTPGRSFRVILEAALARHVQQLRQASDEPPPLTVRGRTWEKHRLRSPLVWLAPVVSAAVCFGGLKILIALLPPGSLPRWLAPLLATLIVVPALLAAGAVYAIAYLRFCRDAGRELAAEADDPVAALRNPITGLDQPNAGFDRTARGPKR